MSNNVSVELVLKGAACTEDALGFEDPEEGLAPIWIPRSQVSNLDDIIHTQLDHPIRYATLEKVEVHMPTWLAENKGLDAIAEELD